MALNGRLPASMLAPIPGGRLARPAALRWNAMCYSRRRRGLPIPVPNGPLSSYRNFAGQVVMKLFWTRAGKPQNAATPGSSNHGNGTAVDSNQARYCDENPVFGWDKSHSDAPWEPWHRHWGGSGSTAGAATFALEQITLRKGTKRRVAVRHLQVLLRGIGRLPKSWRANGTYSLRVRRAVRTFQHNHGMRVDGVVGPATWAAIRQQYDKKH